MAVETSPYSVKTYYEDLRKLEDDPITPGCFDIYPEHQREFVTDAKWSNELICHFIFHGQLNPVIYHKVTDPQGYSYYENLDGKQRSSAFIRLMTDQFVFKNVKSFPHPDKHINDMLTACHAKYFSRWPENYKSEFLHMKIPVTTYGYAMSEAMKADFFKDLQNTRRTRIGEVLHSYEKNRDVLKIIRDIMKTCEWRRVWKTKQTRFRDLHVFTCMAYHFLVNPTSTKDVTNDQLINWIDKHGNEVSKADLWAFTKLAKKTMDLICELGDVAHASSKNTVVCFFFLLMKNTPGDLIEKIYKKYAETQDLEFPNVIGKSDQAYRRYLHLITTYIDREPASE